MSRDLDQVLDALDTGLLAGRVQRNAPIGSRTTYRVGGTAAALVVLDNAADVDALSDAVQGRDVDMVAIGRGSNLLVSDDGFDGVAVLLGDGFATIDIAHTSVTAGAAVKLPVLARTTVQAGLAGLEWAVGVPGSVGGAVRMNAGGHGAEIAERLEAAEVIDLATGRVEWRPAERLDLRYRSSSLSADDLVLQARFVLAPGDPAAGKAEMAEIVQWRRDNQPGGQNAGSVFTNPPGDSAGRLIDAAGLKGFRIGSAEVSTKHANFIQADADGTAGDVLAVMHAVRDRVRDVLGIDLRTETHLVGFDPETTRWP